MARDNFGKKAQKLVYRRAGSMCSICRMPLTGPHTNTSKAVNVGVVAHIRAASPGGARYDASQSPQDRASADNAILLCETHGKLIDSDAERYTVETLIAIRAAHEAFVLDQIIRAPTSTGPDLPNLASSSSPEKSAQMINGCAALLSKAQSGEKLSVVAAELLALAIRFSDAELRTFCEHELAGYPPEAELPLYRVSKVHFSFIDINTQYAGWNGQSANVLAYMANNPDNFIPFPVGMRDALSHLESQPLATNTLRVTRHKVSEFPLPTSMDPNTIIFRYSTPDIYKRMLKGARQEITQRLVNKLRSLAPL